MVGGVGFGGAGGGGGEGGGGKAAYRKPDKRTDLTPGSAEAKEVAEEFNDKAVRRGMYCGGLGGWVGGAGGRGGSHLAQ
jgi:hypothetical protein